MIKLFWQSTNIFKFPMNFFFPFYILLQVKSPLTFSILICWLLKEFFLAPTVYQVLCCPWRYSSYQAEVFIFKEYTDYFEEQKINWYGNCCSGNNYYGSTLKVCFFILFFCNHISIIFLPFFLSTINPVSLVKLFSICLLDELTSLA